MLLKDKLVECKKEGKAILATNFYNFETLKGVLMAASGVNAPLILQLTKSSIDYLGLENALSMARSGLKYYGIEGWVHLDHGDSVDLAERCLKAGFDSVMYDGSELPFDENIEKTKQLVKLAKAYNANVEAELGYIAKLGQPKEKVLYTEAKDARLFAEETQINALAVAIGTAHGFYKSEPKLDFVRLAEIGKECPVPLVLHGGSGVPGEMVQKAVSLGICKLNVATEIKNIFMLTLKKLMHENTEIDLRIVFPPAIEAVSGLVKTKLMLVK